jgi:hypothetical protein
MVKCPRCGLEVTDLHPIDSDLSQKLAAAGEENIPDQACRVCISDMRKMVSRASGGVLLAQERALEQHRITIWKSRVQLIKKARGFMAQKSYAEAAITYEKYLKILEMVFQCKKGEVLTPEMFKDNARTSELTVVASVYWDLLRLYDNSGQYANRQMEIARQLAVFIRFTPIFPDIIKRAEAFVKQAKNPDAIKLFLRQATGSRPRCFVATSAFESPRAVEVQILRFYRDHYLRKFAAGRKFIQIYYRFSPVIASFLDHHPALKPYVRGFLRLLINCVGIPADFALARIRRVRDL